MNPHRISTPKDGNVAKVDTEMRLAIFLTPSLLSSEGIVDLVISWEAVVTNDGDYILKINIVWRLIK